MTMFFPPCPKIFYSPRYKPSTLHPFSSSLFNNFLHFHHPVVKHTLAAAASTRPSSEDHRHPSRSLSTPLFTQKARNLHFSTFFSEATVKSLCFWWRSCFAFWGEPLKDTLQYRDRINRGWGGRRFLCPFDYSVSVKLIKATVSP